VRRISRRNPRIHGAPIQLPGAQPYPALRLQWACAIAALGLRDVKKQRATHGCNGMFQMRCRPYPPRPDDQGPTQEDEFMTAIVLPDLDRKTIEELRKKIPNLSEIELPDLPSMKQVSKSTDETIDRLLGRSKAPVWPWIAAGVGLVAVIGALAAYFAWFRRPTWESTSDAWATEPAVVETGTSLQPDELADRSPVGTGLTAAESSLASSRYPIEEA
jgi:hypothetical protein